MRDNHCLHLTGELQCNASYLTVKLHLRDIIVSSNRKSLFNSSVNVLQLNGTFRRK